MFFSCSTHYWGLGGRLVMSNTKQTVVVAMSGGVDSSVAAGLLLRQGYDVVGITMQIWQESATETKGAGCCSLGAVEDARRVAAKLGIPHYVLNFREFFAEKVIANFVDEYKRGRTPNPCVNCNRYVKFDALLAKARALGAEYLATGHYARVEFDEDTRRWTLRRALDHCQRSDLCPVPFHAGRTGAYADAAGAGHEQGRDAGHCAKSWDWRSATSRIRRKSALCRAARTPIFWRRPRRKPCRAATSWTPPASGAGRMTGSRFIPSASASGSMSAPLFHCMSSDINAETNTIVVGGNDDLMAAGLAAEDINWVGMAGVQESRAVLVKIRYNMEPVPAVVQNGGDGR